MQKSGVIDSFGALTAKYDVATQKWGDKWRMPTKEEFDELIVYCDWTWIEWEHGCGYLVQAPRKEFITMVVLVLSNIPLMYFLNKDGFIKTGWIKDNGKWYYLYSDSDNVAKELIGTLATDTWIDNYYVDKTGAQTKIKK